jgi:hypothetical protein
MANKEWTVKDLIEALKKYPSEAKVYYEMGPNGPGTIGKAQYVEVWGEGDEWQYYWTDSLKLSEGSMLPDQVIKSTPLQ